MRCLCGLIHLLGQWRSPLLTSPLKSPFSKRAGEGRLASGFEGVDVGHQLRVQWVHTDVERGFIDFKRVP